MMTRKLIASANQLIDSKQYDLVEGVMHLIDEDEANREKKKKEAAAERKAKAEHARKLRDFARRA